MTGGTRGIGAGICHSLMGQGATAAAGYSRDREKAEAFLAELSERGGQGSVHHGNVGCADDCRRTIAEVIERYGHLHILVNAGITVDRTVLKMTDEDWFKVMAVNLSGAFFLPRPYFHT